MSRVRGRGSGRVTDWAVNVENHMIDVSQLGGGGPLLISGGSPTITLDLTVTDDRAVHLVAERCAEKYGHYVSVDVASPGSYRIIGIPITLDEAERITRRHQSPLEVLLGSGRFRVAAVPVDLREFL